MGFFYNLNLNVKIFGSYIILSYICNIIKTKIMTKDNLKCEDITPKEFNKAYGTNIRTVTNVNDVKGHYHNVVEELDKHEVQYFYISLNIEDIYQAIKDEPEMAEALKVRLIRILPYTLIAIY